MQLPKGATVAVADGAKFNLFRNAGDEAGLNLIALAHDDVDDDHKGSTSGAGRSSSQSDERDEEDGYSTGVAEILNRKVLEGKVTHLLVVAAPRTLGALRKHYHAKLSEILVGEIAKDLTGHSVQDVEKAVAAA